VELTQQIRLSALAPVGPVRIGGRLRRSIVDHFGTTFRNTRLARSTSHAVFRRDGLLLTSQRRRRFNVATFSDVFDAVFPFCFERLIKFWIFRRGSLYSANEQGRRVCGNAVPVELVVSRLLLRGTAGADPATGWQKFLNKALIFFRT